MPSPKNTLARARCQGRRRLNARNATTQPAINTRSETMWPCRLCRWPPAAISITSARKDSEPARPVHPVGPVHRIGDANRGQHRERQRQHTQRVARDAKRLADRLHPHPAPEVEDQRSARLRRRSGCASLCRTCHRTRVGTPASAGVAAPRATKVAASTAGRKAAQMIAPMVMAAPPTSGVGSCVGFAGAARVIDKAAPHSRRGFAVEESGRRWRGTAPLP